VLVGDGPQHADVRAAVAAEGLADVTWLPGERDDIPHILRSLDCFVLPSLAEGISNTVLEAMASGVPVVATDVGGNAELVEAGRTGLLVPAADPAALAKALSAVARGDDAARSMGAAGRARVERLFSLDVMVGRYAALYQDELAARGLAPRLAHAA
jgi:glycosyltransferase involved in cell wall biosynthesis